jgi:hypothetical protein
MMPQRRAPGTGHDIGLEYDEYASTAQGKTSGLSAARGSSGTDGRRASLPSSLTDHLTPDECSKKMSRRGVRSVRMVRDLVRDSWNPAWGQLVRPSLGMGLRNPHPMPAPPWRHQIHLGHVRDDSGSFKLVVNSPGG